MNILGPATLIEAPSAWACVKRVLANPTSWLAAEAESCSRSNPISRSVASRFSSSAFAMTYILGRAEPELAVDPSSPYQVSSKVYQRPAAGETACTHKSDQSERLQEW